MQFSYTNKYFVLRNGDVYYNTTSTLFYTDDHIDPALAPFREAFRFRDYDHVNEFRNARAGRIKNYEILEVTENSFHSYLFNKIG